ncbi:MAG TPA: phospholipid carrier-dependent glycosyltransferase, partial [Polyangiaceae bacterium]
MLRRAENLLRVVRRDGPLLVGTALLVLFGAWLRAVDLGFPKELTWDEHHFVLNARNYLTHQHDWNDHPPLGKLLMVLWVWLFADESFGFRFSSLLFGFGNIFVARALAIALYRDRRAGWLAAAFVAADGFLISYSRTALLDGVLTTFVLLVAWLAVTARSPGRVLMTAVFIGCAANIKESGFGLGLPVLLLWAGRPRPVLRAAALALAPVTFAACSSLGLFIARDHYGPSDVLRTTLKFLSDHAA